MEYECLLVIENIKKDIEDYMALYVLANKQVSRCLDGLMKDIKELNSFNELIINYEIKNSKLDLMKYERYKVPYLKIDEKHKYASMVEKTLDKLERRIKCIINEEYKIGVTSDYKERIQRELDKIESFNLSERKEIQFSSLDALIYGYGNTKNAIEHVFFYINYKIKNGEISDTEKYLNLLKACYTTIMDKGIIR